MAERKPLVIIEGNIQQLQDGDTVAGTTTTAAAPEITNPDGSTLFTSINENETKTCKIKDYDSNVHYIISTNKGNIGSIQSDGTFTYTAPDITDGVDTTDSIYIYYTIGTIVSATNQYDLTVLHITVEADGVLSNTDFVANKSSSTNLTVDTNTITATADGAVYIEKPIEQESEDTDWAGVDDTKITYKTDEIVVLSDTTTTELSTIDEVIETQPVILIKSDNTGIRGNLGSVTETSPIGVVDVFGDGSGIALYQLDGNANDTGGNYNGTWHGTEQYDTGKFGQAAKFDGSSSISIPSIPNILMQGDWSISTWIKADVLNQKQIFQAFQDKNNNHRPCYYIYIGDTNELQIYVRPMTSDDTYSIIYTTDSDLNMHFIATTIKNGEQKIYLDNTLVATATYTITYTTNTDCHFWIGKQDQEWTTGENQYPAKGLVDQVRIFNRALTADEVKILYNEKKYLADISSYSLDSPPTKAFKDDKVSIYIDIEDTKQSIVDDVDPFKDNSGIALYQFEGNANDTSGNYNGTWSGTEQYDTGKFGQAAKFDGSGSQGIYIPNITNVIMRKPFSISAWICPTGTPSDSTNGAVTLFFQDKNNGYYPLFKFGFFDGVKLFFRMRTNTNVYVQFDTDAIYSYNNFYFMTINVFNDKTEFYIDGKIVYTQSVTNVFTTNTDCSMVVGKQDQEWTSDEIKLPSNAKVDQVRIFNRALTEQEVAVLYTEEWYKFQNFDLVNVKSTTFDGSNLINTYEDYSKTGRAIQRKIELEKQGDIVKTPFTSNLYKYKDEG